MSKIVYCYDDNGKFTNMHECQPSPLEPGVWLAPNNTTDVVPPTVPSDKQVVWNGSEWLVEARPVQEVPPDTNDVTDYRVLRSRAYPPIAEQLDMIWHDKVNGTNNWQEMISQIKALYPKS